MNEILQKRIEEAAKKYAKQFEQVGYDDDQIDTIEEAIIYGAILSLQNQWISVEEALPEEKYLVLTRVKTQVGIVYRSDYYINDYWYMCRYNQEEIVTHWMPIPELPKGGEK